MTKQDLKGHRAVVTGASSGLGEEYARQLASRGADLVIAARRVDRLKKLATELEGRYQVSVEVVTSDLVKPGAARELFSRATENGRQVTILINNAGVGPFGRFVDASVDKHVATLQLNSVALTELCHYFSTHMLEHGKRSFISNVGSIASFQGVPNFAVYSGSKAFVRVFSEILARELKRTNVSVTCVCPGGTYTEFSATNGQILKDSAHSVMMTAEQVVTISMEAMLRSRVFVVPGLVNKLACFLPRFLPLSVSLTCAEIAMNRSATVEQLPSSTKPQSTGG